MNRNINTQVPGTFMAPLLYRCLAPLRCHKGAKKVRQAMPQ